MKPNKYLLIVGLVLLLGAAVGLYYLGVYSGWFKGNGKTSEALTLSAVVLVGLALVVALMSVLVIIYSVLGVADASQALALPEGSVRSLLAFSLVLIFVCLGAFLYNSVDNSALTLGGESDRITEPQLAELKAEFVVAYEQARNASGSVETDNDGKTPLYNAKYFIKPNKDAGDFAKQIFTTLATVFVSVISFYFGSSTTSSAVGAGARAASGSSSTPSPVGGPAIGGNDLQSALTEAKAAAHDASTALGQATDAATEAKSIADAAPSDSDKKSAAVADSSAAQKAVDAATNASSDADQQVQMANKAVADAATGSMDTLRVAAVAAVVAKARDMAKQLAQEAAARAAEAAGLRDKIKNDMGA
ncbi:MAG: hypothetical protein WBG40_05670 [Candidatus Sulfotelmatobacter sp.]